MMKNIATLLFILFAFVANGQDCKKVFVKQKKTKKKNQSEIFKTEEIVQTKGIAVYGDFKRTIGFSYLERGDSLLLKFVYRWMGNDGFKNSFELGEVIEIAFIFEDSTYNIITFDNPAIYPTRSSESTEQTHSDNYNFTSLTPDFFEKLRTIGIAAYEIKNPFGVKESSMGGKTKSQKIKRFEMKEKYRPIIMNYAQCFYDKVME